MNTKKIVLTLCATAVLFTGCSLKNNNAIVQVNDKVITKSEFEKDFKKELDNPVFKQLGLNVRKENGFMYNLIKGRVINTLILRSLVEQEIEKRHIKVTSKDVDNAIKDKIEKVGSKEKFDEILKQSGVSSAQYKKDLTQELRIEKLVSMIEKIEISEKDAKKYYEKNIEQFKYPDKVRASHILISANPYELREAYKAKHKDATEDEVEKAVAEQMQEKYNEAEKVLAQVKKDLASFADIAKAVSEDTGSAEQGGDLGFFAAEEVVEPFAKAAFSQKLNTVGEIVKSPYGYHIIMVVDRKTAGTDSFEQVKNEIIAKLEMEKKMEVFEKFVQGVKDNAKIEYASDEYNPEKLNNLLRQEQGENPAVGEEVDSHNYSATPEPTANQYKE